ncbi:MULTISPECIES: hypothetical protein [Clostridium]|uniref:hypothetical protein n=1 Tax=Clostridium TaxID=1485 RepID=UPI00232BCFDE|nr:MULTISPECIES: hypothetical protein [Clostridium]MDB2104998.1 hypothetical protein [Clostridium paraputrificum]MDU2107961.1 hypothetical protein [Clostridium sp.]MDU4728155.1 hypothetical protein [Clostridium sp.]
MVIFSITIGLGLLAVMILCTIFLLSNDESNKSNAIMGVMKILGILGIMFLSYFVWNNIF